MLESVIQNKIIKFLNKQGFYTIKITVCNKPGTPDIIAVSKTKTLFIEVKQEKGKLSKLQEYRIKQIPVKTIVAYGYENFINKYKKV